MSNGYRGEKTINLYGKNYPMVFNMNVIAAFESNTGKDFNHTAIKARNAYMRSLALDTYSDRAEVLSAAVSMSDAAWLFFLASKEADKVVEFGEIQEAVMLEGVIQHETKDGDKTVNTNSYPVHFVDAVVFATVGILDNLKKKNMKESEPISS